VEMSRCREWDRFVHVLVGRQVFRGCIGVRHLHC
jgi:hypothetical protein